MEGRKLLKVPLSALLFGALAIVLSILAYVKRIKVDEVRATPEGYCSYPDSASFALGIVAAIAILAEQLIISVGIGCFCCGRTNKCPINCCGIISLIIFVLSWLSFVITFAGLIDTAVNNNHHYLATKYHSRKDGHGCKTAQEGLFLGTAIWCVFTVILGLASYTTFKIGAHHARKKHANQQGNVA